MSLEITIFPGAAAIAEPAAGVAAAANIKFRLVIIELVYCYQVYVKTLRVILVVALAVASAAADKKKKPPDVEVMEASAHRGEVKVSVDGRVRNSSEKPIKQLMLVFDFMAPGKQVITTQKGAIDEELLAPRQEAVFHMELNAPPRSVEFQINASDGSGRELRVAKSGPFPIE